MDLWSSFILFQRNIETGRYFSGKPATILIAERMGAVQCRDMGRGKRVIGRPSDEVRRVADDSDLLMRARGLDRDALAQVHDKYYGQIYGYIVLRVSDRAMAEDLTSDVFVRFLGALRQRNAPQTTLRGWLFGVAAHVVSDYHRRHYRAPQASLDETIESETPGPEEVVEAALNRADLRNAIAELTGEQQSVIALRFGAELPIQDVARMLGKSEGAIKQLQARAIAALARLMAAAS